MKKTWGRSQRNRKMEFSKELASICQLYKVPSSEGPGERDYESLEEYIDNNHPLWGPNKDFFRQYLRKEKTDQDMADFIAQQWRRDFPVDLQQNLSCFGQRTTKEPKGKESKAIEPQIGSTSTDLEWAENQLKTLKTGKIITIFITGK